MDEEKVTEQMTVLVVEPGYAPYEKTIPHELHAMQEIVGGLITAIYPYEEPVGIVANDEGLLLDMDFNRSVEGGYGGLVGPFFVCGLTEDSFCSLPPDQMERFKKKFHKAEILASSTLLDTILSFSVLSTAFRKQTFIEFAVPKQSTVQRTQVQNL